MSERIRAALVLASMFLLLGGQVAAQSTKTIKEKQIATQTVMEYFVEEGIDEPLIESIERYNEKGDLVEIKEFSKRGEVKRWEKYAYDENDKLVEEVFLDAKGRVERTERTLYAEGLKTEKQYFNNKDILYKRKVYEYEYRK
jgi:hypothetical protein